MKKIYVITYLSLIIGTLLPGNIHAQGYINFSKYSGGVADDNVEKMQVVNGETYLVGTTGSPDFPVTNSSVYKGSADLTVTKYGSDGAVLYSTYLGSIGYDNFYAMKIINGEIYILGSTDSVGYPVTNGSSFKGGSDIILTKLNANGDIVFSSYLGGSGNDNPTYGLLISGNEIIVGGITTSIDFPVTSGSYHGGTRDVFLTSINTVSGLITKSIYVGGSKEDNIIAVYKENGFLYLVGTTFSVDMPVTIGNSPGTARNAYIIKLNSNNFTTVYSRYIGGASETQATSAVILNGEVHLTGFTFAHNFPVTNGSSFSGLAGDYIDGYYTKLNSDGSIGFSTYLGTDGGDLIYNLIISNSDIFLYGFSLNNANIHERSIVLFRVNSNGSIAYSKKFSLGMDDAFVPSAVVLNGNFYLSGITNAPDFPVTNGGQYYTGGTGYLICLDATGSIVFSDLLGKMNNLTAVKYANNKFYLLGQTNTASYPVTDSSVIKGDYDNILAILKPDGTNIFGGYIGGSSTETGTQLDTDNNDVFLSGNTNSVDYPVTNTISQKGSTDQFVTRLSFCPSNYNSENDTLSPVIQTVCKFGLAQIITGKKITLLPEILPVIYIDGTATQQQPMIEADYQWQSANSTAGPWTNIVAANFKDYRPVLGGTNQYYRRLSFTTADCGAALIHTSDIASVLVNNLTAPVINDAGPFTTCPNSAVTIGGSPTASGGNPPYLSYEWDMGAGTNANPIVSPATNTIYTLIVTDASGCRQIGQTIVLTYKANAGDDKSSCGGIPVNIGTAPLVGVAGLLYDWQPAINLTQSNIANPLANPTSLTDYILTLTISKSGGGTCSTRDTVRITPVPAPHTPTFAGADKVICLGSTASLGTPAEAGYNYTWSPGGYLISNITSTTTYYPGNTIMPVPNPAIINLTAQKDGCSFSDQVVVATIESRPGLLGCGPRIVGLPDRTPNINETYLWTRISGPGNFTGATNLPQVPVSASVGGTTTYGLTVSYNGGSCFNTVQVPEICVGCNTRITVDAKYKCPSFGVNGGDVTLTATSNLQDPVFTWTPQAGLSAYTGSIVQLTDNVPRTYTVTATDINDTSMHCSYQAMVNDPAFSLPVFSAPDTTICANVPSVIGAATVAGYTYAWTGAGLSNNFISNPTATIPFQTTYPVKITDGNGCEIDDTVVIAVQNVQVNAGQDWQVCSNAVIRLGTAPQPNTSYLWEPQSAPWQNGTSQFSGQPEVQVATAISFIVTATSSAGCISKDTVNVSINNIPTVPDEADTLLCLHRNVLIGPASLPGVIYQWTPATGLSDPNIAQPLASPTTTTTYSLLATFPGACVSAATDQVTVTVSDPSFNLPDINFCPANGPFALGNGAPVNMVSYNWAPAQLVTDSLIADPNTLTPPPNTTTVFTLSVINPAGCRYTDTITIIPVITAPYAGADKTICKNQTTQIGSVSNVTGPGISYSWNPTVNLDDPFNPNPVFTGTTGGVFIYVLTKTINSASCNSTDTVIVTVTDLLPALNSPTVCRNSCVQIGTDPSAGVQYLWTPSTGLSNPNISNPLACVDAVAVSYTLFASDINGCSASANVTVGVIATTAPQITIPTVNACLGDTIATFNPVISPAGNYSYLWNPDNGTLSNINSLNPTILITATGTTEYTLEVIDNVTGCSSTGTGELFVNLCPDVAIIGDFLWFDTNNNGIQDPSELGVSGMVVNLYNSAGFNVGSTTTDADGLYLFSNVPPGDNYYVIFTKPDGYIFTTQNVGGTAALNNSKVNVNGRSNNFNVPAGASILNIDAGIRHSGCVPVTLLSFTANLHDRQVLLNWQTTAEYNNRYFYVERSDTSNTFTSIGRVNGSGTTTLPHNYSLLDPSPFTGMNYYRLRQVDFDGLFAYSRIVPVQLNNDEIVSVYYNSLNNSIQLIFTKPQDNMRLKLYANNGQLIKAVTTTNNISSYTFELPVLTTGIYMLQVINDKTTYSKKLFIRR